MPIVVGSACQAVRRSVRPARPSTFSFSRSKTCFSTCSSTMNERSCAGSARCRNWNGIWTAAAAQALF